MTAVDLHIDPGRLRADLEALAAIGRRDGQGIHRMAFSDGDMQARAWLMQRIEAAGLQLHLDGAANIHARLGWRDDVPSVMAGSHIDTVPGAGHLDGALGVLCALEALRVFEERNVALGRPLEAVAFSDEEGRFGGLFGSQAMAGQVTPEYLHRARDLEGVALLDAMAAQGLDGNAALHAQRLPGSIHAYVELHIEQGPVLDRRGAALGIVDAICGLFKWQVALGGVANHAGTTPMNMRQDAFQGLAEFATRIDNLLEVHGSPASVATVGRVELIPGAANVVPGQALFSLDVRDTDARVLAGLQDAFRRALSAIAHRRGLMFEYQVLSDIAPVPCAPRVRDALERAAATLGIDATHMHSGAAHDAQVMASIAPAGMLFVPSREGRSHSPAEWTAWHHIEAGANVLLHALHRLAGT